MLKKVMFLSLAMIAAGSVLLAQQGQKVTSHNGACQVTVPAGWTVSGTFGIADSADKKVNVAVSSPPNTPSLETIKENAGLIYSNDKVTRSTPSEFQMEGRSMNNKPNVYRGIQLSGKVCIVEVTYESGTAADARQIAESLKAAK